MKRWLLSLIVLATIVDLIVIRFLDLIIPFYHYIGWTLVWLAVLFIISKKALRIIGTGVVATVIVFIIANVEDFLYIVVSNLLDEKALYPFYSHGWVPRVFGSWATPLSWDWLGFPSSYYFAIVVGLVLYRFQTKKGKGQAFLGKFRR